MAIAWSRQHVSNWRLVFFFSPMDDIESWLNVTETDVVSHLDSQTVLLWITVVLRLDAVLCNFPLPNGLTSSRKLNLAWDLHWLAKRIRKFIPPK